MDRCLPFSRESYPTYFISAEERVERGLSFVFLSIQGPIFDHCFSPCSTGHRRSDSRSSVGSFIHPPPRFCVLAIPSPSFPIPSLIRTERCETHTVGPPPHITAQRTFFAQAKRHLLRGRQQTPVSARPLARPGPAPVLELGGPSPYPFPQSFLHPPTLPPNVSRVLKRNWFSGLLPSGGSC